MTIKEYLNPKHLVGYSEKDNKNIEIPFQIDVSLLQTFKDIDDKNTLKFYYVYQISLLFARNKVLKWKKLDKESKKELRKENKQPKVYNGQFHKIKKSEIVDFASNFTTKKTFEAYFNEMLASDQFDIYFEDDEDDDYIIINSPNNLYLPFHDYNPNKRIDVSLPLYKNMNFKKFTNLCVRILAEKPLRTFNTEDLKENNLYRDFRFLAKQNKGKVLLNSKLSFKSIAQMCKISEGRVSQILKGHKKYYLIQEIDKEIYDAEKKIGERPVFKVLFDYKFDEETGEIEEFYRYYMFSNVVVDSKSNFNYRFNFRFPKENNEDFGKVSIKPLSKFYYFSKVFVNEDEYKLFLSNRYRFDNQKADTSKVFKGVSIFDRNVYDNRAIGIPANNPTKAMMLLKLDKLSYFIKNRLNIHLYELINKNFNSVGEYIKIINWIMFFKDIQLKNEIKYLLNKALFEIKSIFKFFKKKVNKLVETIEEHKTIRMFIKNRYTEMKDVKIERTKEFEYAKFFKFSIAAATASALI